MKYSINSKRFNIILDELAEEYKDLLIEATLKQNNEIDIENINISELTKIDIDTKEHLKNRIRNNRIDKTSVLISLIGMIYALFGFMLILVSENSNHISDNMSSVAIICIFFGFIIAIIGVIIKIFFKNKKNIVNKNVDIDYEFQLINKWRIVEGLIYQVSPQNDKLSLKSMINNLEQSKILSKDDLKTLNVLMYYRNKILHNAFGEIEYSEDIKILLDDTQKLIDKLSKI